VYEETGRIGRDRVEDALRDAGYTVSSDDAGRVVREFKNQLKAAPSDPAP
jgi:Ca2+-binding EF-hand superfamily protein